MKILSKIRTINYSRVLTIFSLIAFLASLFAMLLSLYTENIQLVILLSIVSALLIIKNLLNLLNYLFLRQAERQFIKFIQFLLSELSMNKALSNAIAAAVQNFLKNSNNNRLNRSLNKILRSIESRASFSEISRLLIAAFPCEDANLSLSILSEPQYLGIQTSNFVREVLLYMQNQKAEENTFIADNAQKLVEAITISVMPNLILIFLKASIPEFLISAYSSSLGSMLLLIAYALFFFSLMFTLSHFTPARFKKKSNKKSKSKTKMKKKSLKLQKKKHRRIFIIFKIRLEKSIQILSANDSRLESELKHRLRTEKNRYLIYSILASVIMFIFSLPIYLIISVILLFALYPELNLIMKSNEYIQEVRLDMPKFIQHLVLLISAGNNIEISLTYVLEHSDLNNSLRQELLFIKANIRNGKSIEDSFQNFSNKLDNNELISFLELLNQYSLSKTTESLSLLKLQLNHIQAKWQEDRRKDTAKKSSLYLVPMLLNLLSVFLVCLAPILSQF